MIMLIVMVMMMMMVIMLREEIILAIRVTATILDKRRLQCLLRKIERVIGIDYFFSLENFPIECTVSLHH